MSILIKSSDHNEIMLTITKSSFAEFQNGGSLDLAQEVIQKVRTQIEILDLKKKGKKNVTKRYSKIPVRLWKATHFLSYLRDKHKELYGDPIGYLNDNRPRTIAALGGLIKRFDQLSLDKEQVLAFINWVYEDSDIDDVTIKTFLMKRYIKEWLDIRKVKTTNKKPVLSSSFKSKMMGVG